MAATISMDQLTFVVGEHCDVELGDPVVLRYLNRLSDLLFVAARHEEQSRGLQAPPSHD